MKIKNIFFSATILASTVIANAQELPYQEPPKEIKEIALAKLSPIIDFSEDYKWMLQLERAPYYSVSELAQPELRLAGIRINPETFSESRQRGYVGVTLVNMETKLERVIEGFPDQSIILNINWSPQSDKIIFFVKEGDGVYLYQCITTESKVVKLSNRKINACFGTSLFWINNNEILILAIPENIGNAPVGSTVPQGALVQENSGKAQAARTYQDLLKNKFDESLFDYYFTSEIIKINNQGSLSTGIKGVITSVSLSPNKELLFVEKTHKPYSYIVPISNFPTTLSVTDINGKLIKTIAEIPLVITAMGYDTTSPYPRNFGWRPDKPATLFWTEAQDNGDPKKNKTEYADIIYQQTFPFTDVKKEVVKTKLRSYGVQWGNDSLALITESSAATRLVKTSCFKPGSDKDPVPLFEFSRDDNYNNPGRPHVVKNQYDKYVLYTNKKNNQLLLLSDGASPEGNMPYLSLYDITKKKNTILWRCKAPYYETISRIKDPVKLEIITARQSITEPVNFFIRQIKSNKVKQLTNFPNPYPSMKGVSKEQIRYKREDGVDLTATVYLPAGYSKEKDGRLPVIMWAYPREYKSASDAAQVRGSKYTFTSISYGSPIFWVKKGYCVMDNVEMPIVGGNGVEPNDNFTEQLVMNAEAAAKVIHEMGVGDTSRLAVGGHSYGAFMTANLLVHTNLFKAGIARSGAYNRTLTPFGFQAETRTYWQAPEVYNAMSPFMYADKLNGALLLIHGELDNNSGTFPIQSERFFQALKGHGATVRYVVLPLESHGYSAKENILHMLYETDSWLEKYVK